MFTSQTKETALVVYMIEVLVIHNVDQLLHINSMYLLVSVSMDPGILAR